MRNKLLLPAMIVIMAMLFWGCSAEGSGAVARSLPVSSAEPTTTPESAAVVLSSSELFSNRDFETDYDADTAVKIELNGDSVSCDSEQVGISGTTVTISDEGCFVLSGSLNDGMIIVDAEKTDKIQLVLDGAEINSDSSAPIYVLQADKVFVTLAEGSENTLSNGGAFTAIDENNIDAVIFSKDDLTLNGSGSLTISSPTGHGVVSKDSLTITGGSYNIGAASNGLDGKDEVSIADGSFVINAGKDAIQAENDEDESSGFVYIEDGTFELCAEGDGISASAYMQIDGGSFDVIAGGGSVNGEERSSDMWGQFTPGNMMPGMGRHGMARGGEPEMPEGTGSIPEAAAPPEMPGGEMEMPDGMAPPEMPDGGMGGQMPEGMATMENMGTLPQMETTEQVSGDGSSMKGFKAKGELKINGGSFIVDSADDAFHSDVNLTVNAGEFEISSGDDAFHAEDCLTVNGGSINITKSYEGLEALHVAVCGGDIAIVSDDDGLNAAGGTDSSGFGGRDGMFGGMPGQSSNGSITIAGGNISIIAYGDGLDANGSIEVSGGDITVCGPTYGDTAILDYYSTAVISGGSFIGSGSSMMAQNFSDYSQGLVWAGFGQTIEAGTGVDVIDSDGNTVMSLVPELDFELVIVSSPELSKDGSYSLRLGGEN